MDKKITMNRKSVQTVEDTFNLFIRKGKVKNLTDESIKSYGQKIEPFYEFFGKATDILNSESESGLCLVLVVYGL